MKLATDVAVLFVDPRGPYPARVERWYDEERDARRYTGGLPVVAHPPCGPWGNLRHLYQAIGDRDHAPFAIGVVRRTGGVLEHPARSELWSEVGLPRPGDPPDDVGGYTILVNQVNWGHVARKPTWLYILGCSTENLPQVPPDRQPTHWVSGFRWTGDGRPNRARSDAAPAHIKICSAEQRRRTPPAFADWLIEVARRCGQGMRSSG